MTDNNGISDTTIRILLGLAIFFASLIGLVVGVGLVQGTLDPTGIASLLGGIFTGLGTTIVILLKKGGSNEPPAA